MGLKMSGYICDKCRVLIIPLKKVDNIFLGLISTYTIRIYCEKCGAIIEKAENYMLLKDAGIERDDK